MALPIYTADRRKEIAALLDIDEQYLYQICKGHSFASAALARRLHQIDPAASLQDLRPNDWQTIWPELSKSTSNAIDRRDPALPTRRIRNCSAVSNKSNAADKQGKGA